MTALILAATFGIGASAFHFASIAIAIIRFRGSKSDELRSNDLPPISVVRPLCGIDNYAAKTLRSTFELDYPSYEILFCVESASDPIVPVVEALIAENRNVNAKLLVGSERVSTNPKLNNVLKGWRSALHEWIIIADSNVLMPRDYIQRMRANWQIDTGLVVSPPIGSHPEGVWAEIECAFLNTYQARWQYLVDSFGYGFAQGKNMLWRRSDLDAVGGIAALGKEVAEDAAATKLVRDAGLRVRLVHQPLVQPLGRRTATEVWNRQVRWARLRRASFFVFFLTEIFSGGILPLIASAIVAHALGISLPVSVGIFGALWYGSEMLLATAAGWHLSVLYPIHALIRDFLLPALFVSALHGSTFVWRGNEMQVEHMAPRRMMARVRPGLQKVAARSRRRIRSLRARVS